MKSRIIFYRLCISFALLTATPAFSQCIIDYAHNGIRIGDELKRFKLITNSIWDLSQSEQYSKQIQDNYLDLEKRQGITKLSNGRRTYYAYCVDTLYNTGSEDPQNLVSYYLPEIELVFPLSSGKQCEGYFAGYGKSGDKISFHKYGWSKTIADSTGTLTLRDGTLLPNVLRVKHIRKYVLMQYMQNGSSNNLPPCLSPDSIKALLSSCTDVICEEETKLYARGYRYPIVEETIVSSGNKDKYLRKTYYFPPSEQEFQLYDEANCQVRKSDSQNTYSSNLELELGKNEIFNYVSNNPENSELSFRYSDYAEAHDIPINSSGKFILSDNKGVILKISTFSIGTRSTGSVSLAYSGLRRGQYILSLSIDKENYSTNFIIK